MGAAGIRGTVYRIVFRPSADGKAFFTISTAEGHIVMQGVTTQDIPVDEGKEVVVEIDTNNPTNPVVVTQSIPAAVAAAIQVSAQELTQVLTETILTNPPPPPSGPTVTPQPPQPQPAAPDLTPGAGQ